MAKRANGFHAAPATIVDRAQPARAGRVVSQPAQEQVAGADQAELDEFEAMTRFHAVGAEAVRAAARGRRGLPSDW